MDFGICPIPYMPFRESPRESSQMVSTLLFGETYEVLESRENWHFVRMTYDGYEGWLFTRSHNWIAEMPEVDHLVGAPFVKVIGDDRELYLGLGTPLPDGDGQSFNLGNEVFRLGGQSVPINKNDIQQVVSIARNFLETPYLWGGRCGYGIDCSGFTQILLRYRGIAVKRDAKDQVLEGKPVAAKEAQAGDIAYFQNENGKVVHSGLIIDDQYIIHASGKVRQDAWDEKGIYNERLAYYTHELYQINRF